MCSRGLRKLFDSGTNLVCFNNIPCFSRHDVNTYKFRNLFVSVENVYSGRLRLQVIGLKWPLLPVPKIIPTLANSVGLARSQVAGESTFSSTEIEPVATCHGSSKVTTKSVGKTLAYLYFI